MQINPDYNTAVYTIRSYETGEIIVYEPITEKPKANKPEPDQDENQGLIKLQQSFIVTPKNLIENWGVENPTELKKTHFEQILDLQPEIVILGTGNTVQFPESQDCLILQQNRIGLEVMGTSAACRTYNFLVADGRNVAAMMFMLN